MTTASRDVSKWNGHPLAEMEALPHGRGNPAGMDELRMSSSEPFHAGVPHSPATGLPSLSSQTTGMSCEGERLKQGFFANSSKPANSDALKPERIRSIRRST